MMLLSQKKNQKIHVRWITVYSKYFSIRLQIWLETFDFKTKNTAFVLGFERGIFSVNIKDMYWFSTGCASWNRKKSLLLLVVVLVGGGGNMGIYRSFWSKPFAFKLKFWTKPNNKNSKIFKLRTLGHSWQPFGYSSPI